MPHDVRYDISLLDNTTVHLLRLVEGRVAEVWLHNWNNNTVNEFWS